MRASSSKQGNYFTFIALSFALVFSGCAMDKGFIYFPEKKVISTPADVDLRYEDLYLTTGDGVKINAWFVPFEKSRRTLLWFHGNGGNIGNRVDLLSLLHQKLKSNILIIDYRGYGLSEGEISEEGTRTDARAAYDYLLSRKDINPQEIVLFGRSLGAAVAIDLAADLKHGALILEAPFTSIKAMAKKTFPFLPTGIILKTRYDSISKIKSIRLPLLILHGNRDQVVPFAQGQTLFEAANAPKTFYTIQGAGHNDSYIVGGKGYFEALQRFIVDLR